MPAVIVDYNAYVLIDSVTSGGVSAYPIETFAADQQSMFFTDYYYRFLIVPPKALLGVIQADALVPIRFWNSDFSSTVITATQADGFDGLSVSPVLSNNTPLGALSYIQRIIQVSKDGGAFISARFSATANGISAGINISGQRTIIFVLPPNWVNPVVETLEWKTDVLRAYNGSEQRRELRRIARRTFEYDFTARGKYATELENTLWTWQNKKIVTPIWTEFTKSIGAIGAGQTVLYADTKGLSFVIGGRLMIYKSIDEYEICAIGNVTDGAIDLTTGCGFSWPSNVKIYPVFQAHLPTKISMKRHTDNILTGRISYVMSPSEVTDNVLDTEVSELNLLSFYSGTEVLEIRPNWRDAIDTTSNYEFDTLDATVGAIDWYKKEIAPTIERAYGFLLKSKSDMLKFRKMLGRLKGQLNTLYIPSWHNDNFRLQEYWYTNIDENAIFFRGTNFYDYIGLNPNRNVLRFQFLDGSVYYLQIALLEAVGGDTKITFTTPTGFFIDEFNTNEKSVSIVLLSRLATDKIEIPWITDMVADVTLKFTSVIK